MRLLLSSIPPSANQLMRMHWAVKKRLRTTLQWELVRALHEIGHPLPPIAVNVKAPKRRLLIIAYRPRRFDLDNAYGGCKVLIDAMRDVGLIRNDSPKWLELRVEQVVEPKRCRTEIEVEDA